MGGIAFLHNSFWGNSLIQWISAALVAVGAMLLFWAVGRLVLRRLESLSSRTLTGVDDLVAELFKKTKLVFVLLVGVWAGSHILALSAEVDHWIREILVVGLLLQGALWTTGILTHFIGRYHARQLEADPETATAMGAVSFLGKITIWTIFLLLALQNLGINVTTLLASLGIGGIAVALALQNVLGDLFASLSIVLDKPFVVGDFIIVDDFMGTVEHVGLKTTRVRSLSGEQLVFSNSDLLKSRIRNYKRMRERRILFTVGVTYDTDEETVARIPAMIREAVEARDDTRFDRAHFKGFGDSALTFETVYYMLVPDYNTYMDVQQEINLELLGRFREEGIDFAFPSRTVYLETGSDASDSNAAPAGQGFAGSSSD